MRDRSAKYWTERASELEAEIQADAAAVQKRIIDIYKRAIRNIQDDIEDVFSSFLKLEELDPAEGRALISAAQAKEQYEELKALLDEVTDEAERRSIRRRINAQAYGARMSRLEALKERVYNELTAAAAAAEKEGAEFFKTVYQKSYYSTIYNTAKGLGAGVDFSVLNKRAINAAAAEKWSGLNYSDRVWKNNKQFIAAVQRVITDGIAAGHSPYRMAEQLGSYARAEDGKSIQYVTERLTRTEAAHFLTAGQLEAYKDIGVKKYRYMAALSERTCEVCGSLDGSVFRTSDAVPGKNYPPIHPRCRCTTIIGDFIPNSRRAQDPLTGKGYKVDGSVTFEEWRDGLSPEQREAMETHVAEMRDHSRKKKQYERYKETLGAKNVPKSLDAFEKMPYNDSEGWAELKRAYRYVNTHEGADMNAYRCVKELRSLFPRGSFHIPAKPINTNGLSFDDKHVNEERTHGVTRAEAVSFIRNAKVSHTVWQGQYERYYSDAGAAYVNVNENHIRTAFKATEFKGDIPEIMEVLKKYGY